MSTEKPSQQYQAETEQQAYDWLVRMHAEQVSHADSAAFQAWLAADTRHQRVYAEISEIWSDLPELKASLAQDDYQLVLPSFWQRLASHLEEGIVHTLGRFSWHLGAVAAVLAVSLFLGMQLRQEPVQTNPGDYATQTAEIREVRLADGSVLTLGASSAVEVRYSAKVRRVELLSGEAFFRVEKDPDRPFIVATADAEVRVVGTQFDVRRSSEGVRVSVLEGIVEVIQSKVLETNGEVKKVTHKETLGAHQKARVQLDGTLTKAALAEHEQPGAWQQGRLIYENAKLSEIISDADRYYGGNIIIDTEDLKDLELSASFRTDQINEMMTTLTAALPLSAKKLSNGDIVIRRRDDNSG